MTAIVVYNRLLRIGRINLKKNLSQIGGFCTFPSAARHRHFGHNEASHLGAKSAPKPLFLVNTFGVVRRLEVNGGVATKQAEVINGALTNVLNNALQHVNKSVVSREKLHKSEKIQDGTFSQFKSEVRSMQDHQFSLVQQGTEKLLNDLEKMRTEIMHEIDKVTAGQRLDMILEKQRLRDQLAKQISETSSMTYKFDKEMHGLRIQMVATKLDVMTHCIATVVSVSAIGLAVIRLSK